MALFKPLTIRSGHVCSYWRITAVEKNYVTGSGTVELSGYRDQQARADGLPPAADAVFRFEGYVGHGGTEEAYEWIKAIPEPVPGYTVPNPDFDPEKPEGEDGNAMLLYVPEALGPGPFADAENC